MVAAQEERDRQGREDEDVDVLGEEEEAEAHAAVLGVKTGHELVLGLGQVEGGAVPLGQGADEVDEEADEDEGVVEGEPLPGPAALALDDRLRRQRARQDHRHHQRQAGGDLVADDLGRRAHAAEEGPLVVGRPAGHHQAQGFNIGGFAVHHIDNTTRLGERLFGEYIRLFSSKVRRVAMPSR